MHTLTWHHATSKGEKYERKMEHSRKKKKHKPAEDAASHSNIPLALAWLRTALLKNASLFTQSKHGRWAETTAHMKDLGKP